MEDALTATTLRPIRVLLFTDADVFAGTERHVLDLALGLREEGVRVRIACPSPAALEDRAAGAGIETVVIQKGGLLDRGAVRRLVGLLSSGEIDLIHAHNGRTTLSAALAVSRAKRGCCVATQHFLEPSRVSRRGIKGMLSAWSHRWVNRRVSCFIAISDAVRRGIEERREAGPGRIVTIPNGIADPAAGQLRPPNEVRRELGVGPDQPLLVCVARLEREKDIGTLIAAMPAVLAQHPRTVCLIAGEGSQRAALSEQIQGAGLGESVRLLGFRPDAISLVNAADVFVLPSLAEPFGLAIVEAMALGKPVIATRAGGPLEIVVEGETGLLVPPGDAQELSRAMLELLLDPATRISIGQHGRERYSNNYTAQRMCEATARLYRRVLAQPLSKQPIPAAGRASA